MIVIGLTGSIGMGKSVVARQLRALKVPVHDSDACVHRLLRKGGAAVKPVAAAFPPALKGGAIGRKILGTLVFDNPEARTALEGILHPLVRADSEAFLKKCRMRGKRMAALDVPLLFEKGYENRFDHIICVTAPYFVQKRRVLSRQGMNEARLRSILAIQMPDALKRARADTVINTAHGYGASLAALKKLIKSFGQTRVESAVDAAKE